MNLKYRATPVAVLAIAMTACTHAPMSYMRTYGPAADSVTSLGWGLTTISVLVILVVVVLVLIAVSRARSPQGSLRDVPIERGAGGLRWIYIGTGVSTLVLLGIMVWTLVTLAAVASPPRSPAFTIEIRAHQWWWEARYIDGASDRTFITANELHIPIDTPVRLHLIADDVIHSFWVPALAGKTDVIPGQTNVAWLQANQPGVFRGQCTEYCGAQHAHMGELVIADPQREFQTWWQQQLAAPAAPRSELQQQGRQVFLARCAACHAVRGTAAGGISGPDLTHLMSRHTIAAGTLPNDPEHLTHWIANAQTVKPGCRMPALELARTDLLAVSAYVQTLN